VRKARSVGEQYSRLTASLERASLDPSDWERVSDELAAMVGATGALIFPFDATAYGAALPHSSSLQDVFGRYVFGHWIERDPRVKGLIKARRAGFMTDQDLITSDAMGRHPYYGELLAPSGLKWSATISIDIGGTVWGASVHGSPERGAFQREDVATLVRVRGDITLAVRRAAALGNQRIASLETALGSARAGFVALGWNGKVIWQNASSEAMLREADLTANGRIRSRDPITDGQLSNLIGIVVGFRQLGEMALPSPVVIPLTNGRRFSIDAIPMPRDFQALASGASTLITITEISGAGRSGLERLKTLYGLTPREVELCQHLLAGTRLAAAAVDMKISVSTARQHVKSVFAKTGTHGQAELVALLGRISGEF